MDLNWIEPIQQKIRMIPVVLTVTCTSYWLLSWEFTRSRHAEIVEIMRDEDGLEWLCCKYMVASESMLSSLQQLSGP